MQQDQFSSVSDEVRNFLRQLKRSLRDQNAQEILTLYEYGFTDLTERFCGEAALPDEKVVISVTASDPSNVYDSLFVVLYKELYYRFIYAKSYRATSLKYRVASYYNYMTFFDTILAAEEPLQLTLPDQWLWDIVDEFVYQFHAFCQYKENINSHDDGDIEELKKCDNQVWNFYNVVDVLYALAEKASIEEQLAAVKSREPFIPDANDEFFKHPLYYKLAYFSLVSLLRLHTQLGEYHQALKMVENIEFTPMSLYNSVPSCQVTLHFYVGFCHLMKRQYQQATRLFVESLLYIQRTRPLNNQQIQQKSWQYDLVGRINDQMYQLLAICVTLEPQRIEESVQSELYKLVGDRFNRLQRGEIKEYELAFQSGCPRFLNPLCSAPEDDRNLSQEAIDLQAAVFRDEIRQQRLIPILRGCLKLYSTIKLSKLSSFMDNDERELTNALLCYKVPSNCQMFVHVFSFQHKMYDPEKCISAEDNSSVDLDFYINLDMIHIADTTVARRYGEYFIHHIQQLIEEQPFISCMFRFQGSAEIGPLNFLRSERVVNHRDTTIINNVNTSNVKVKHFMNLLMSTDQTAFGLKGTFFIWQTIRQHLDCDQRHAFETLLLLSNKGVYIKIFGAGKRIARDEPVTDMQSTLITAFGLFTLIGQVASQCFATPKAHTFDTVYRYYNARTTENRLESDTGTQGALLVQGYGNGGIVGKWVKSTAKEGNACTQLKPVYRLYSKEKNSVYYLINEDIMQVESERGYENQGIVGYAVSAEGLCQANTPIFEFGHKTADMQSTAFAAFIVLILVEQVALQQCFTTPAEDSLQKVTRYYSTRTSDNRLETDESIGLQANLFVQGFGSMGVIGRWVSIAKSAGNACTQLKPVYKLYSTIQTSTYYMINQDLITRRQSEAGYTNQGIVGYAVTGEGVCQATVPVYEFFRRGFGIVQVPARQMPWYLPSSTGYVWQGVSFAIWPEVA
ncbi:hypothetical protein M514_05264, partial [Trichuris suis]